MILSFSHTTDAFLAGRKTVTRRRWSDRHAAIWLRAWDTGALIHSVWNKTSRCVGAKPIGTFELTFRPYQEQLLLMPKSDLEAEGGLWESLDDFISLFGGDPTLVVWVMRFKLIAPS